MEYKMNDQHIGYEDGGVVTYEPRRHRRARRRLRPVVDCMSQLGAFDRGFLVTLDGELPNLVWGATAAQASHGEAEALRILRAQIRGATGPVPGTVLLYRGVALRLFGSDHPGSIVTTVPAR